MSRARFDAKRSCFAAASLIAACLCGCGGDDSDAGSSGLPSVSALTASCTALNGQTVAGVTVTATKRFEAAAGVNDSGFCKVSGNRAPFLDIEVDLPDNWSGRLFHQGGAGFDGTIPSAVSTGASGVVTAVNLALTRHAAVYAASNGGNRASIPSQAAPAVWASGTADGQASANDYAYVALGTTIKFAKAVTNTFFSRNPRFTYFSGCSNGGRNAYTVAQRWPDEYDGIVAGCETEDMTGQTMAWLNLGSKAGTPAALSAAQYSASYSAAVSACDSQDGLTDQYINNAAACGFDPALLQCGLATANSNPALCLSSPQVQTLKGLLGPLKLSDGTLVYSGFNWTDFSAFGPSFGALGGGFALLATGDPSWLTAAKQATFNIDVDYPLIGFGLQRLGADHDRASLASFAASGKKIISWHDTGDNLLSANDHARNDALLTQLIRSMGVADPSTSTRLFLVPSNFHTGGRNLTEVDWASAIIDWVERGTAPTQLTYTFATSSTGPMRSLPVCLYPKAPRYNGSGDVNVATSFTCM